MTEIGENVLDARHDKGLETEVQKSPEPVKNDESSPPGDRTEGLANEEAKIPDGLEAEKQQNNGSKIDVEDDPDQNLIKIENHNGGTSQSRISERVCDYIYSKVG